MIKIEDSESTTEKFCALLPASAAAGAGDAEAEIFTLWEENRTRVGKLADESDREAGARLRLRFENSCPGDQLGARRGRFSDAERDNILCLLASPDGRFGSIKIGAEVRIYTCLLGAGEKIFFRIAPGHSLCVIVQAGGLDLGSGALVAEGSRARVEGEDELTLLAQRDSEFLMLDLA